MNKGDPVNCPKCGAEVYLPVKEWVLRPKKGRSGLRIMLYECPRCHFRWRKHEKIS